MTDEVFEVAGLVDGFALLVLPVVWLVLSVWQIRKHRVGELIANFDPEQEFAVPFALACCIWVIVTGFAAYGFGLGVRMLTGVLWGV